MLDTYRQLQAERWRQRQAALPAENTVSVLPSQQPPVEETPAAGGIAIVAVDATSLESIKTFLNDTGTPRAGILFGAIAEDGFSVIVDAIYECSQDVISGEFLLDSRLPMVRRLSHLMGLRPVGILVTADSQRSVDMVRLARLEGAISHILLMISSQEVKAVLLTEKCLQCVKNGSMTDQTSLTGLTVNGGLDGTTLHKAIAVAKRTVNTVIHTGFYRLNRPNHTPTFDDARAFIVARRDKAKIDKLHLQLADYHLLLFLADALGENSAERIILAIFQEEDELVENLVEMLLSSTEEL